MQNEDEERKVLGLKSESSADVSQELLSKEFPKTGKI
jgi:hypothetical protein